MRITLALPSKSISYAIWVPEIARAHVTLARGVHFSAMGHSVPHPVSNDDKPDKMQKRLELLPEEAIYLIERGAMFCWKERKFPVSDIYGLDGVEGSPMSVQQAFAEMIGKEDLTLEKYQVWLQ
jgi:tRNA-splicing endonuclease subunit Sen54